MDEHRLYLCPNWWISNFRRTARGSKVDDVKEAFASYGDKFQVIAVNDIAADDLSEHFKDVSAVIHTAAPMASALTGDDDAMLKVRAL